MMKKIIAASLALVMMLALVPAALADQGNIEPYNGLVGADSPLYSIKLFVQHMDVFLTFDNTGKMKKQMAYADERIAEMQAMALANNSAALQAALDEYEGELEDLNETAEAPDINESEYANLSPMLYHHQQCFYAMMNNTSANWTFQGRYMIVNDTITKMKNGMPFYYYNGSCYFIPPGQMKKMQNNSSYVPPGLVKKGYMRPVPTITNGSTTWPWDEINYSFGNKTIPGQNKNKTNGNGNGNGKGNGNGNNK
jgi:Domain of unknown function (DUF5667)